MLERDRNYSAPSSSSASSNNEGNERECSPISEPGPSAAIEPKSAIDVALELIAQEELEALNAARIAALNKPKPRGRPPLSRKTAENTASANAKTDSGNLRPTVKRKETERSQMDNSHPSVLMENGTDAFPSTSEPILKDHLEVEAAARIEPQSMEVSLFGADNGEPESTDFHKMVLLNYGSVDGRLEDDEDEEEEEEEKGNNSGMQWRSSKESLPPLKESSPKKESRESEENAPEISSPSESAAPVSGRRQLSPSNGGCSTLKDEKPEPTSMETDEVNEPAVPSKSTKRGAYVKKARGRPRKSIDIASPPKTRRPRGRPRKDGGDSRKKGERKSTERKLHERLQKRRPRRAAAMIQDFLELYAKVDLADLEIIHARATTFVRMLVDEYIEEAKASTAKSSSRSNSQSSRDLKGPGSDAMERKNERKTNPGVRNNSHYPSRRVSYDATAGSSAMDDMASAEEPESSAEEVSAECGYESSSDPSGDFGEETNINDLPLGRTTSLSDSFIDSIPVIRGTVLQQLPTVIDSV